MSRRAVAFWVLVCWGAVSLGCAGGAWNSALREDSAAAYARFLRENPRSEFEDEAKARLAFVRARSKPTRHAFDAFQKKYPGHPLVDELKPYMQDVYFDQARALGTAPAYADFVDRFPSSTHSARVRGNIAYLEAAGFVGDSAGLRAFIDEHPASDYAAEAKRSLAALDATGRDGFRKVGLVVDVPASVPNADRLRRLFVERAVQIYGPSRIALVPLSGKSDPMADEVGALLVISHRESDVAPRYDGEASESIQSVLAETTLRLRSAGGTGAIWEDVLAFRVPRNELKADESALLHPRARSEYWQETFFVPIASWDTRASRRESAAFEKVVVDVEVIGSRAIVLFGDGDFRLLDLSDPNQPVDLGHYARSRDLARFEGVKSVPQGIAVFGADGVELVQHAAKGLERAKVWGRDLVGSVVAVEPTRGGLLAASNRGLLWLSEDGRQKTLFPRPVLGLAQVNEKLVFTDGVSLFVTSFDVLRNGRVEAEMRLGRGFRPGAIRLNGTEAAILGDPGVAWVSLREPLQPRLVSRIERVEVGEVRDAAVVSERIYLVGPRGLQVSDASGEQIVNSVDVDARHRLGAFGRHVVVVGEDRVQVVDTTAFGPVPASR